MPLSKILYIEKSITTFSSSSPRHIEMSLFSTVPFNALNMTSSRMYVTPLKNECKYSLSSACSYPEMITHIHLASHRNPNKVSIIGGGHGGVVREMVKHDEVEEVVCSYFPRLSNLKIKRPTITLASFSHHQPPPITHVCFHRWTDSLHTTL